MSRLAPEDSQLILLKLIHETDNSPEFGEEFINDIDSEQLQWTALIGALLRRLSIEYKVGFTTASSNMRIPSLWTSGVQYLRQLVSQAIEDLKLELELSGRDEIGQVYEAGDTYKFFKDIKSIVKGARLSVFVIDPYFTGEAFDDFLSDIAPNLEIKIFSDKYAKEVDIYAKKHRQQFNSKIILKKSRDIHDRLIVIDDVDCYILGASVKDGGKKPTYIIPLQPRIGKMKSDIYDKLWIRAAEI